MLFFSVKVTVPIKGFADIRNVEIAGMMIFYFLVEALPYWNGETTISDLLNLFSCCGILIHDFYLGFVYRAK